MLFRVGPTVILSKAKDLSNRVLPQANIFDAIVKGSLKIRSRLLRCPCLYPLNQVSPARALFQYNKMSWPSQFLPPLRELPSHAVRKKRSGDIGAGIVIGTFKAYFWLSRNIIAIVGLVQSHAHIRGKGQSPFALDTLDDELL